MAWTYHLELKDFYRSDDLSIGEKSALVAERIKESTFYTEAWTPQLQRVVDEMSNLAAIDGDCSWFDSTMEELYNYADVARVWVSTF